MKACIFVGPSGRGLAVPEGIDLFGPARLGSVHQAVLAGYRRIAIVDAFFGNVPSVWHKEILFALAVGAEVWGAGSTGALRAAELADYGMRGVGIAYRLFRRGVLTDDDELCLLHGDRSLGYPALTLPMINVRYTLRRMRRAGFITVSGENELAAALKNVHFTRRHRGEVRSVFQAHEGNGSERLWLHFESFYTDIKKQDTQRLLRILSACDSEGLPQRPLWTFPQTTYWRRQFVQHLGDFPPLNSDYVPVADSVQE